MKTAFDFCHEHSDYNLKNWLNNSNQLSKSLQIKYFSPNFFKEQHKKTGYVVKYFRKILKSLHNGVHDTLNGTKAIQVMRPASQFI